MSGVAREVTAELLAAPAGGPAGGTAAASPTFGSSGGRGSELLRQAAQEGCDILNKLSRTCRSRGARGLGGGAPEGLVAQALVFGACVQIAASMAAHSDPASAGTSAPH